MGISKYADAVWNEQIGPRYRDERQTTARVMAAELGVHEVTLTSQMRRRGFCRNLAADSAPAPGGEDGSPGARPALADLLRFDFDPEAPAASLKTILAQACRAAADGRTAHFRDLMQSALLMRRVLRDAETPLAAEAGSRRDGEDGTGAAEAAEPRPALRLRPAQTPPAGDWSTWLFLGGRGAGKTLAGADWLADMAGRTRRLALVGATLHDVREVMIGGPSGLMALPRWDGGARPVYEPSRRRLVFPNGAEAWAFSAEDPDSLRGPQFEAAWADEFCAWSRPAETLAMLRLGLRLGTVRVWR